MQANTENNNDLEEIDAISLKKTSSWKILIKQRMSLQSCFDATIIISAFAWGYYYLTTYFPAIISEFSIFINQLTVGTLNILAIGLLLPIVTLVILGIYVRRLIQPRQAQGLQSLLNGHEDYISQLSPVSEFIQDQIKELNKAAEIIVDRGTKLRQTLVLEGDRIERTGDRILNQQQHIAKDVQIEMDKVQSTLADAEERTKKISIIFDQQQQNIQNATHGADKIIDAIKEQLNAMKCNFDAMEKSFANHHNIVHQSSDKIAQFIADNINKMQSHMNDIVANANSQLQNMMENTEQNCQELGNKIDFSHHEALALIRQAGVDAQEKIENTLVSWHHEMQEFANKIDAATAEKRDDMSQFKQKHVLQLNDFIDHIKQQSQITKDNLDDIGQQHHNALQQQIEKTSQDIGNINKKQESFLQETHDNFKKQLDKLTDNQQIALQESSDYHTRRIEEAIGLASDNYKQTLTELDHTGRGLIGKLDETIEQNSTALNDLHDSLKSQTNVLDSALSSAEMRVENMSFSLNKQSQTLTDLAANLAEQNKDLGMRIHDYGKDLEQNGNILVKRVDHVFDNLNIANNQLNKTAIDLEKHGDTLSEKMNHNNQILMNGNDKLLVMSDKFEQNIRVRQQEMLDVLTDIPEKILSQFDETMVRFNNFVQSLKEQGIMIQRSGEWAAAQARDTEKSTILHQGKLEDATKMIDNAMIKLNHMLKEQTDDLVKLTSSTHEARQALENSLSQDINALDDVAHKLLKNTVESQGKLRQDVQELSHFNERLEHQQQRLFDLLTDQLNSVRESLEQVRSYLSETGQVFRERAHDMRSNMDTANKVMQEAGDRLDKGVEKLVEVSGQTNEDFTTQSQTIEDLSSRLSKAAGQVSSTMHLVQNVMVEQGTMLEHSAKSLSGELDPLILRLENQSGKLQTLLGVGANKDIEDIASQMRKTVEELHRDTAFALGAVKDMSAHLQHVGHEALDQSQPPSTQANAKPILPSQEKPIQSKTTSKKSPAKASNIDISKRFLRELGSHTATIADMLSTKLNDSDWQKYKQGDYEALARIMMRRGNRQEISEDVNKNTELQKRISAFLSHYQNVMLQARHNNQDTVLSQMLETSAFGRLNNNLKKMIENINSHAA